MNIEDYMRVSKELRKGDIEEYIRRSVGAGWRMCRLNVITEKYPIWYRVSGSEVIISRYPDMVWTYHFVRNNGRMVIVSEFFRDKHVRLPGSILRRRMYAFSAKVLESMEHRREVRRLQADVQLELNFGKEN